MGANHYEIVEMERFNKLFFGFGFRRGYYSTKCLPYQQLAHSNSESMLEMLLLLAMS